MRSRLLLFGALSFYIQLATAQTGVTCTAFVANQPTLRQEGATESAGDIIIQCSGALVGAQLGAQTLSLYVNGTTITSRELFTGSAPTSIPTEAALLVNDNVTGSTVSGAPPPAQGFLQNGALVFSGFTLPNNPAPNQFQVRITNVRVNASQVAAGTFITGTVLATFPVQNQSQLVLGVAQSSLSVSVSTPVGTLQQCGQQIVTISNLTIRELVNTAFKVGSVAGNSIPGQWYQNGVNTEAQTVLNSTPAWANQLTGVIPGQADAGTRIRINVLNIPPGVTVSLPVNVSSGATGSLVATTGDLGPFAAMSGTSVSLSNSGSVTYEVRSQNGSGIDSFTIPVSVTVSGTTAAGTVLVSATYAPTNLETGSAIPRFADTSVSTPAFNLLSCLPATHLNFTLQPANGVAGTAIAPVSVQSLDVFGNVTASNPAVTITSTPAAVTATVTGTAGVATFGNLVFGTPGTFTLTATAPGLASITSHSFVIRGPTTVSLSSSLTTARYGQNVMLTAAVSPAAATGNVTFYDGATILGTSTLAAGQAQLTNSLVASGSRILKARYVGNPVYTSSLSGPVQVNINAVPATTLQPPVNYAAGLGPAAVAVGDLNHDGIADLVIAANPGGNISVLLGNGNGTFQLAGYYSVGNQPVALAIGDLNGDGKADVVVANSMDGTVTVLLGKGDGTFQAPLTTAVGTNPFSLAIADFNGDGLPDLVVVNYAGSGTSTTGVGIYLGKGDGTFQTATNYTAGLSPVSVAVGDFNGDGNVDVAVANLYGNNVSILLGNGDGTLQYAQNYATGNGPDSIVVADFNGDGVADLAVANLYSNSLSVLLGNGDGSFRANASYPVGNGPYALAAGDFNGDGKTDLVSANINGSSISVLLGVGSGFGSAMTNAVGNNPESVAVGDFNGDGIADVAVANFSSNNAAVLLGGNSGTFQISGYIGAFLSNITVTLSGSQSASTLTDGLGHYIFEAAAGGSYTVTPTLSGYMFAPASQTFNNLSANQAANFAAAAIISNGVFVSGQATAAGVGVPGATINITGSQTLSTNTDASGNFIIALLKNGTYTLTASRVGYSFSSPVTYPNLTVNQTANFTGIAVTGLEFYPVTPCRVADTRAGAGFTGTFGPPSMGAGSTRTFTIPASGCGIPMTAAAYSLNFTVVPPAPLGNLTTWPAGQPMPNVSTLNDPTGTVVANAAIVPAGTGGAISVFVTQATDVLFDINGYFAPPQPSGLQFYPVTPCRVADTRAGGGKTGSFGPPSMTAGSQRSFPVQSSSCGIPATAAAYSLNFTAVPKAPSLGLLTTWPTGQTQPNASTLNSYTGTVVANAAIVPAGSGGAISVYVSDAADVLFDINGYFAPASTTGFNTGYNFYPVTPCRVADTRPAAGFPSPFGAPTMAAGTQRAFPIQSSTCGIPNLAAAYSFNFTVVPAGYLGYLTTWPSGQTIPVVSTLNSYNGTIVANAAIVPGGSGGSISIYVTDKTDVLFDVNGYFAP